MSASKILFFICLAFIGGIGVESAIKIPQFILWIFLCLAVFSIFASLHPFMRSHFSMQGYGLAVMGFCILFFCLGVSRQQIAEFEIINNKLSQLNGGGEIALEGVVHAEPDVRSASQNLKIKTMDGLILATTTKYPEYHYLDSVKITGKPEVPFETDEFSYKNYLLKDGVYSVMGFPKIQIIGHQKTNLYSAILVIKQKLRESIQRNFSPPESTILEGTVLGDNGAMSKELKDKLNITGLRHVIAVSGTHIVILCGILMSLFLLLGMWRHQAFYFSVTFIWLYIILTGLSASGVRAGIVGTLYLLAQKLGRQSMGARPMIIAAGVMLAINPLLLFYDVGFQLSFLAAFGLIYLGPFIQQILEKFLKFREFSSLLSATLSAQLFTMPILLYNFGSVSLLAPITNILVLPIVDYLMIFGFLASFGGLIWNFLGWILSAPCWVLLAYFAKIIDLFSSFSWASRTVENVHWIWLGVSYFGIAFLCRYLRAKLRPFT